MTQKERIRHKIKFRWETTVFYLIRKQIRWLNDRDTHFIPSVPTEFLRHIIYFLDN